MLVQLAIWSTLPHDVFFGPDPGAKYLQAVNFSLEERLIDLPGEALDPELRAAPLAPPFFFEHEGSLFGIYNPLFVALSALSHRILGFAGLYLVPILAFALLLLVTSRLVMEVAPQWRPIVPPLLGLASPLLFYSMVFWEHTLGVLLATLSLWLLYQALRVEQSRLAYLIAGLAAGTSFAFRAELGAWCVAMVGGALIVWPYANRRRLVFCFGGGILVVVALFQLYEWLEFGALAKRQITANYGSFGDGMGWVEWGQNRLWLLKFMLLPFKERALWQGAWLILALLLTIYFTLRVHPLRRLARWGVWLLSLTMTGLLLANYFSLTSMDDVPSLVQSFPLVLLLGPLLVTPRRRFSATHRALVLFIILTSLLFLILVFLTTFNEGGAQWGPRYLLVLLPMLVTLLLALASHIQWSEIATPIRWVGVTLATVLLVISAATQYMGVLHLQDQLEIQQEMIRQVEALDEQAILVNQDGVTLVLAPIFYDKLFFMAQSPDEIEALIQQLQRNGIDRFAYVSLIIDRDAAPPEHPEIEDIESRYLIPIDRQYTNFLRRWAQRDIHLHYSILQYQIKVTPQ